MSTYSSLLTSSQKVALEAMNNFLNEPEKREFILTGSPGTGKTFLMKEFMQQNSHKIVMQFSATTHKAASCLSESLGFSSLSSVPTIHSLLGLRIQVDYANDTTKLVCYKQPDLTNSLVIIDESSMIDHQLYDRIKFYLPTCKFLYVGDKNQLAPVKSKFSIFTQGIEQVELTEIVRCSGHQQLVNLSLSMRNCVKYTTLKFANFSATESIIDFLPKEKFLSDIAKNFEDKDHNNRIVTYTNKSAILYNTFIRNKVRNLDFLYQVGEHFLSASSHEGIAIEDEVVIYDIDSEETKLYEELFPNFICRKASVFNLRSKELVDGWIPNNINELHKVKKEAKKNRKFSELAFLDKNCFDLRQRDACTIHKVQGSTVNTVYIDLDDIGTATVLDTVIRLLYVAATRATSRVVFTGKLPDRLFK